ncbi:MAG: hypothetical protein KGR26_13665 [Cyanobacteria bacterium REEB65]|nr:hypothetical protein [Cyanobacteria bacterium REEB65]
MPSSGSPVSTQSAGSWLGGFFAGTFGWLGNLLGSLFGWIGGMFGGSNHVNSLP